MEQKLLIQKIRPVLKRFSVEKSALFGSYARGEETAESDVDILVQLPKGKSLLDLIQLKHSLEDVLQKKVDIVSYGGISPFLKDRILSESVPIYAKRSSSLHPTHSVKY